MPDDATIIDIHDALNRTLGDTAFLKTMFDEFQEMMPAVMRNIRHAIEHQEMDRLGKEAHQLKGSAASLGAREIAATAFQLEKMGKNGDPSNAPMALSHLESAIERFNRQLFQIDWVLLANK